MLMMVLMLQSNVTDWWTRLKNKTQLFVTYKKTYLNGKDKQML
jgi:hypothetical protein